jgi:purine-binding chemotaxis protein CheW
METTMKAQHQDPAHAKREYLAFALGAEQYAVDLLQVQEIRSYETVTRIANAPAHIQGVINLRGRIVPILDLRIRFGLEHASFNEQTVVIILNVREAVVGAVVDAVSDVVEIGADDIKDTPTLSSTVNTDHLTGMATVNDRMLIMLDMDRFLSDEGLVARESALLA